MEVAFSERPGRHERHFRRRIDNPLMPRPVTGYSNEELLEVQRLDHEELLAFLTELRQTVQRAVNLGRNEESQTVLDLKADLERLYETACGLADDHSDNKAALVQLISVIMNTVRAGAQGDPLADQELSQEEQARETHFRLLEFPLVADLLHPQSVIMEDELIPVLLTAPQDQFAQALTLFDDEQLALISDAAASLLQDKISDPSGNPELWQRLEMLKQRS